MLKIIINILEPHDASKKYGKRAYTLQLVLHTVINYFRGAYQTFVMNLSASQEIIAFIITILGLVLVILKLYLSTKQLKQQSRIDKKQLEEEKQFLLSVAEEENKKEQQANNLYKKTVQSVLKYVHEEFSEYVKKGRVICSG